MSRCEALDSCKREPPCTNKAEWIFYNWKHDAGYPMNLCKDHLNDALSEYYDYIRYSMERDQ